MWEMGESWGNATVFLKLQTNQNMGFCVEEIHAETARWSALNAALVEARTLWPCTEPKERGSLLCNVKYRFVHNKDK